MSTVFPSSNDVFSEPVNPASVALKSAGSSSRAHTQNHQDMGDAIEAMQAAAVKLNHLHTGSDKLAQSNTHQSADTDVSTVSIHHTLGTTALKGSSGSHNHDGTSSFNIPIASVVNLQTSINLKMNVVDASVFSRVQHIFLLMGMSTFSTKGNYGGGVGVA